MTPPPNPVTDLAAVDAFETFIVFTFTPTATSTSHEYRLNGGAATALPSNNTITGLTSGTSYTIEVRGVSAAGAAGWSNVLTQSTIGAKAGAGTITTAQAGNWSATSTWTGGVVPTYGKSVTINHNVTVNVPATVGASNAATTNAEITVATGVTLTIAANRAFRARGNVTLAGTGKVVMGAGSIWEFDASLATSPNSQNYRCAIGNAHSSTPLFTATGVSTNRAKIRSNAGGGNGYFNALPVNDVSGPYFEAGLCNWNYVDATRLGTATIPAIKANVTNSATHSIQNTIFDTCGMSYTSDYNQGVTSSFTFLNVTMKSTLGTDSFNAVNNAGYTSGTRLIQGCVFDKDVTLYNLGWTVKTSIFLAGFISNTDNDYTLLDDNWFKMSDAANNNTYNLNGTITNNVAMYDAGGAGNPHYFSVLQGTPVGTQLYQGNIFGYLATSNAADMGDAFVTQNPSASKGVTLKNNIVLPNLGRNEGSGTLITFGGGANVTGCVIEHNTCMCSTGIGTGGVAVGESYAGNAGMISSFKSNLMWGVASSPNKSYKLHDSGTNDNVSNLVTSANCNNNTGFNLLAGSNLKGYHNLEFSSGSPGANDVDVDPQFVDANRHLDTWDASLGGPGTAANVYAQLSKRNDPTGYNSAYTTAAFRAYIQAGYTPQASTIQTAAHDGGRIGAV
jgi:hypothetical protein